MFETEATCPKCKHVFRFPDTRRLGLHGKVFPSGSKVICPQCGYSFESSELLRTGTELIQKKHLVLILLILALLSWMILRLG